MTEQTVIVTGKRRSASGEKRGQIGWLLCVTPSLRNRTWTTLGLSLHCTHLMTGPTSHHIASHHRRKESFSTDSRLLEYSLVHKGKVAGSDADLRSRWQSVRHYGFCSNFHIVFAMCSCLLWVELRMTFRSIFCSGIFAFVDREAQQIRRQKQKDSCNSFVSPVRGE